MTSLDELEERAKASQSIHMDGDQLLALLAVVRAAKAALPLMIVAGGGFATEEEVELRSALDGVAALEAK